MREGEIPYHPEDSPRRVERRFSKEVERWFKRAVVALPLVVGCAPERGIKQWVEQDNQRPIADIYVASTEGGMIEPAFIETEEGALIPRETKRAISEALASATEPTVVALDDRPAQRNHGNHEHTKEAFSLRESPGLGDLSAHRHGSADPSPSTPEVHRLFPWRSVSPTHEHGTGQHANDHGDIHIGSQLGHKHGADQHVSHEHQAPLTRPGKEGTEVLDLHSHAEIPILSGAGNVVLGLEKRSESLSGQADQHLELGLQGPLYAGLRPGTEIKFSDHGLEYLVTFQYV
ncbi:MAG: hypothetical protein HY421_00755, partial [Candidatus Kerfeldbacteria bacterium]|nr:hypothetical protein [Candidatus Kerfeldbacteria bacterium]